MINLEKLTNYIIVLFPITTVIQGIPGFNNINRLCMAALGLLLFIEVFKSLTVRTLFLLLGSAISWVVSIAFINKQFFRVNDVFYFILWILYFLYITNNYNLFLDFIKNNLLFIKSVIIIWSIIVIVSIFSPLAYENTWGEGKYFKSFADCAFRYASTCLYILALIKVYVTFSKNRKFLLFLLIPIISVSFAGSRTYLAIVLLCAVGIYYVSFKNKKYFYLTVIPLIVVAAYGILFTSMGAKFAFVEYANKVNYKNKLAGLTSGRTIFWAIDLRGFLNASVLKKIFGSGLTYVYELNKKYYGREIWAHNDFINLLVCNGIVGLFSYCYVVLNFLRIRYKQKSYKKIPVTIFLLAIFLNAFFNGVYTYLIATLAIPFLFIALCENENSLKVEVK